MTEFLAAVDFGVTGAMLLMELGLRGMIWLGVGIMDWRGIFVTHNLRVDGTWERRVKLAPVSAAQAEAARPVKVKKGWAVATEWPLVREMLKKVLDRFPDAKRAVLEGMDQLEMGWESVVILEKG